MPEKSSDAAENGISWPPGWSRHRYVHAELADILDLPTLERERMMASLRETLGPEGFEQLSEEQSANYWARVHAAEEEERATSASVAAPQVPSTLKPPALSVLEDLRLTEDQEWGWIAFRTGSVDPTGDAETRFRQRFDAEIANNFATAEQLSDATVQQALARFSITWIADAHLAAAGPAQVAARYRAMREAGEVPPGKDHNGCLLVDDSCFQSVMDAPIPGPRYIDQQRILPFVIAVDHSLGHPDAVEYDGERGSYRVAVRALCDSYFVLVASGARSVSILGAGVRDNQIWWSVGRHGIFTPS